MTNQGSGPQTKKEMQNFLEIARKFHAAGLAVIPYVGKEHPLNPAQTWRKVQDMTFPEWKKYRTKTQTKEEVEALFKEPAERIALLCTGNIEGIDIDVKNDPAGTIAEEYFQHIKEQPGGAELLEKCVLQATKSGGFHIIYRAANRGRNQKLTTRAGAKEAVIETRGEGGLLFIAPSPGYDVTAGSLLSIPEITEEERSFLICAALELSEVVEVTEEEEKRGGGQIRGNEGQPGERPGDAFNTTNDPLELLEAAGWKVTGSRNSNIIHLTRPGSRSGEVHGSILTTRNGGRVFYPFTTSTAYTAEKCYSAFAIFAQENHAGNLSEAARALRAQGYGGSNAGGTPAPPVQLYGLKGNPAEVVLVQDKESAQAAEEAGLLGVVAIEGALDAAKINAARAAGAKRFTVCFGTGKEEATFQAVEALLRYQETERGLFWVFVAGIEAGNLGALLGQPGGRAQFEEALREQRSAAAFLAQYFATVRAPIIARQHTAGRLDKDLLRPYFKEELTLLFRLLPPTETAYFEHLLAEILEGYFLTWEEIRHDAQGLKMQEAEKRYRQEAALKAERAAELFREGKKEAAEEELKGVQEARRAAGASQFSGLHYIRTEAELRAQIVNAPPTLETPYKYEVEGKRRALKLPAGGLSIFAGRPEHGKSRMLVNLALEVVRAYPGEVHYFTFEESAEAVTIKALNCFLDRDLAGRLYDGNAEALEAHFRGERGAILEDAIKDFEPGKEEFFRWIEERRLNIHFSELRAESLAEAIRYLHGRGNVSAVFVDYIQLLTLEKPGRVIGNRQQELKEICNLLKDVARETGLPLILAAQFGREVASAEQMKAAMLREAGDIEQTAALIVGLWNRFRDEPAAPEIEARILKNRGGAPNGSGVWQYNGNRYRIYPNGTTTSAAAPGALGGDVPADVQKLLNSKK